MQLDDSYRNAEQISPEILREYSKNIYWNLIWYFADNHLPYDFLVPYAGDDWLWHDFIHANDHIVVRNRVRVDQLLSREGGIESYIRLVEERAKKEHKIKQMQKIETSEESARENRGLASSKKGKKKVNKAGMSMIGGSE